MIARLVDLIVYLYAEEYRATPAPSGARTSSLRSTQR
jgi:hypothetical protein